MRSVYDQQGAAIKMLSSYMDLPSSPAEKRISPRESDTELGTLKQTCQPTQCIQLHGDGIIHYHPSAGDDSCHQLIYYDFEDFQT